MTMILVENPPIYYGISSDISNNAAIGVSYIGAKVFTYDDGKSYTVKPDGTLVRYSNVSMEKPILIINNTTSTSGDNLLIAAPGVGLRIVVAYFLVQNESAVATTLILKDGTTGKFRTLAQNQGDGLGMVFTSDARWKLTANTALNLSLSGANLTGYSVGYYIE